MTNWQERIDRETAPAIRTEHELRYLAARPLVAGSGVWADLGCGNATASARVLRSLEGGYGSARASGHHLL